MSKQIPLTRGKFALVDDDDYLAISLYKWFCSSEGYAVRTENFIKENGSKGANRIRMHRVISDALMGFEVDHVNGDKLDNRKENLRVCSKNENSKNRLKNKNGISRFKGVHWLKANNKWLSRISCRDGKRRSLGLFLEEIDAAIAYNNAAIVEYGAFAKLNEV